MYLSFLNGERISQKKCKEYAKYAVIHSYYLPLLLDGPPLSLDIQDCDYEKPLIVGGEEAQPAEFPHMAAIGWNNSNNDNIDWGCGGILIAENIVLTAAHCNLKFNPQYVRLGDHDLQNSQKSTTTQDFTIKAFIRHPEFKIPYKYNDIALIILDRPAVLGKFVRPACLWQTPTVNNTLGIATGWGQIGYSGPKSDVLLKVALNLTTNEYCNSSFDITRTLPRGIIESQLCAGYQGKDTCLGDSGGPIQVVTPGNICIFHILGIVSTGKFCGSVNTPGIYTRVSSYLDWIESIAWP
ncbi:serine protease snake-like isoform X1 [Sergentomyia squamirostris]